MLPFFTGKRDARGKLSIHTLQRVIGAFCEISHGAATDAMDELVRLSETSMFKSLMTFCEAIGNESGARI